MFGETSIDEDMGTMYIFENRYVVHIQKRSANNSVANSGEFRTGRIRMKYTIKTNDGAKSIILGQTNNFYIRMSYGEVSAIKQAILYLADKVKAKVFQSYRKPDYGFEMLAIQPPAIISVKKIR